MSIVIFTLLILISFTACKPKEKRERNIMNAEVVFKETDYHFENAIKRDSIYTHTFQFVNSGDVPAVVLHVKPSCKCTGVKYSKDAVLPGAEGFVELSFEDDGSTIGYFDKTVKVMFNSPTTHILRIRGKMSNN